jgi:hypothetical protein
VPEARRTRNGKKQIPFGNDRKKGKSKSKSKGKGKSSGNGNGKGQNAGISPLRRQKAPPPVEMTDGWLF